MYIQYTHNSYSIFIGVFMQYMSAESAPDRAVVGMCILLPCEGQAWMLNTDCLLGFTQEIVNVKSVKGDMKNPAKANPLTYINELQQILTTPMLPYHAPAGNESEDNAPEEVKKEAEEKEKKDFNNGGFSSDEDSSSSGDQDQDDYGELLLKKDIPPDNLPMLIARVMYRGMCVYIRIIASPLCHQIEAYCMYIHTNTYLCCMVFVCTGSEIAVCQ